MAPTISPTTCYEIPLEYDQLSTLNSNDGKSEKYPLNITQQISDLANSIGKTPDVHTKADSYRNEYIYCNPIDTKPEEICYIACDEDSGCDGATVSPFLNTTKQLYIICSKSD
eukprot:292223_1